MRRVAALRLAATVPPSALPGLSPCPELLLPRAPLPFSPPAQAKVGLAFVLVTFGHLQGGVIYAAAAACCGLLLLGVQWKYPAFQPAGSAMPLGSSVDEDRQRRELRRHRPNAASLAVYAGLAVTYLYQLVVAAALSGASCALAAAMVCRWRAAPRPPPPPPPNCFTSGCACRV